MPRPPDPGAGEVDRPFADPAGDLRDLSHAESLALGDCFLVTKHGGLDLVNGSRPDLLRYRRLAAAAIEVEVAGQIIRAISKDDLIQMKAGRRAPQGPR